MELTANNREILGKKVKILRRNGITPVHLFGHQVEPLPLQCDTVELQRILTQTGKTGLINLKLESTSQQRNVMVREVQREPRSGKLLHVDFYQVRMDEKLRVEVPIVTVGEAPALKSKENFLAHELNTLNIECLPDEIPGKIEVDISSLTEDEQAIHVRDIVLPGNITVLDHPDQMVVKITSGYVEKEEAAAEARAEAPEEAAAAEEGEVSSES